MHMDFKRARRPEQKEERRSQLLGVACTFLEEGGSIQELSLNELARRVGMAKSNVYRYFETREALLLELLEAAWTNWVSALLATREKQSEPLSLTSFIELIATSVAGQPLLGQLTSALPSVLEHNLTVEAVRSFKLGALEFFGAVAKTCHALCPTLSEAEHLELLRHMLIVVTGLWPYANPAPVVAEVCLDPKLAPFRHDFASELKRMLGLYATGIESVRAFA